MRRKDDPEKEKKEAAGAEDIQKRLQTGYYLIELLSAVLADRTPRQLPDGLSMKEVFKMSCEHSVETIAYYGAVQVAGEEDGPLMEVWQQRSYRCTMRGKVQMLESGKIYRALTETGGFRILPLKGCILKDLYPKQEYRQMSDLDILIDKENTERAREIMEDMGYETKSFGDINHDCYRKPPWMTVELHHELFPYTYENARSYQDVWEKAFRVSPDEQIYQMRWEDFYVFMVDHFVKHYYLFGSGIRSVMDIHVFLQSKAKEMDRSYLRKELERRKIWEFEQEMERIAAKWFRDSDAKTDPEMERSVICSAVYGVHSQGYSRHMEKLKKKYHFLFLAKIMRIMEITFPRCRAMEEKYPILKKCPFLLPVCWIRRWVRILFTKQKEIRRELDDLKTVKKAGRAEGIKL